MNKNFVNHFNFSYFFSQNLKTIKNYLNKIENYYF